MGRRAGGWREKPGPSDPTRVRGMLKYSYRKVAATKTKPAHVLCECSLKVGGIRIETEGQGDDENDAWKRATARMKAQVDTYSELTW